MKKLSITISVLVLAIVSIISAVTLSCSNNTEGNSAIKESCNADGIDTYSENNTSYNDGQSGTDGSVNINSSQLVTDSDGNIPDEQNDGTHYDRPAQGTADQTVNSVTTAHTNPAATNNNSQKPETTAALSSQSSPETHTAVTETVSSDYTAFQVKVLELVNAEREKQGIAPLTMSFAVNKVATLKSQDMADNNYFSHTSPTYGSPFDMLNQYGISYTTAGENIAVGQTTPEQVMQSWMNSDGHRSNILNESFTKIGIGVAENSQGRLYWTQQFIG